MSSAPAPAASARVAAAVEVATRPVDIPRLARVYVNRNLPLERIEMVGFDMDYTLALYNQHRIEDLSLGATIDKLVVMKGYPKEIRGLRGDPALAIRGLVVDRDNGNLFKPDRYGTPGRARHGLTPLPKDRVVELYLRERTKLGADRYAWIDSLFALPEAVLYALLVDFFDALPPGAPRPPYPQLWADIRESIDLAHRDGSIKTIVAADLAGFIERDPALAETLHKFRSSGKRLFLLTNSAWDYTNPVMSYLLDGTLPAYPSWRNYFDVVVVSAAKPGFFTDGHSFVELDGEGLPSGRRSEGPFSRGRVYSGGNLREFQERARLAGNQVLYVGDHIYGDMLRSRKSSSWRTAMVLQELEHEIAAQDGLGAELARLDKLDHELAHLDTEINERHSALKSLQKLDRVDGRSVAELSAARRQVKDTIDHLRAALRETLAEHARLERETDNLFNPHWGPLFREGNEISKFAEQVEAYACVYTSRVSNFRYYSPMQYLRGPRDWMPHER